MDETELTQDEVNDLLGGDERDAGWGADDEYERVRCERAGARPRHAEPVVRRVLLRRNIAIDAETAQLVANAVQAVLQPAAPSRPPRLWAPRGPGRGRPPFQP